MAAGAVGPRRVRQRVLALLLVAALVAAAGMAFLTVAPNRLVTGTGLALPGLWAGVDGAAGPTVWPAAWLMALLLPAAMVVTAVWLPPSRAVHAGVAVAATALLATLVALAGAAAAQRAATLPDIARVSLGGGFWALALLAWLAASDALQRLRLPPAWHLAANAAVLLPVALLLTSGALDALSLLKEYDNRQDVFVAAGWRHLQIVLTALLPALLIGVPLGVAAARRPHLATPLFAALNLVQTMPSIALFGLLIAPLARLGEWLPASGVRGIGLWPAAIALVLYALLPIVHGTAAGLRQVPAAVRQAATGMGLSTRQCFWQVEVPLALPVLLAGLRLTSVQLVGLAVVAALIGAGGYGALVFQGLLSSALDLVLLGVLPVVALALAVDAGFTLLEAVLRLPAAEHAT
jgi:osmoprotectant transport system permease protein